MYLITKIDDGVTRIISTTTNSHSAIIVARTNHPCKVWKLHTDSADLLPAWDAERFEKLRQKEGDNVDPEE